MGKKNKSTFLDNLKEFIPKGGKPISYIYFVVSLISRKHTYKNRVKIGVSQNPHERIRNLQVGNPYELSLWYTFPVDADKALYLEDQLHLKFKWSRIRGEWFQIHKCVPKFINEHRKLAYEYKHNPMFGRKYILRKQSE